MNKAIVTQATTTATKYFQDPVIKARRGRNEWEANRRWRQCLEMELIGNSGCSDEYARESVRSQRPWLYEHTDAMIAALPEVPLTREQNFVQAYTELGCEPYEASVRGMQRVREDDAAVFQVEGCTNYSTAKVTVWLLEAAQLLCSGDFGNAEALRLIEMARKDLVK